MNAFGKERVQKVDTMNSMTAEPTSRRERNKQEKLERIREAAQTLFHEKGFDQTTMREIADRAEVGLGTIFLYASSKADLLFMIYAERIRQLNDATPPRPIKGFVENTMWFFSNAYAIYAEDMNLGRCFFRELMFQSGEQRRRLDDLTIAAFQRIAEHAAEAQRSGELAPNLDPQHVARIAFSLYQATLGQWISNFAIPDPNAVLRHDLELLMHGLAPQGTARNTPLEKTRQPKPSQPKPSRPSRRRKTS